MLGRNSIKLRQRSDMTIAVDWFIVSPSYCLHVANLTDGADDHTTEVRCSLDLIRWPDGFAKAKMYTRIQHELEPSCVLRTFFGMSKILYRSRRMMVLPKA